MPSPSRYVVSLKLANVDITPRRFLRLEHRLFATITPAWRDTRIAAREAVPEPPSLPPVPTPTPYQDVRTYRSRPPARYQQVLDAATALAEPGEYLPLSRIAEASGIPLNTVQYVTRPARRDGSFPYVTRKRDRRKSHASSEQTSR